jgi:hypothetical protein
MYNMYCFVYVYRERGAQLRMALFGAVGYTTGSMLHSIHTILRYTLLLVYICFIISLYIYICFVISLYICYIYTAYYIPYAILNVLWLVDWPNSWKRETDAAAGSGDRSGKHIGPGGGLPQMESPHSDGGAGIQSDAD